MKKLRVKEKADAKREREREKEKERERERTGPMHHENAVTHLKTKSLYLSVPRRKGIFCFEVNDAFQLVDVAAHAFFGDHQRRDSFGLRRGDLQQPVGG